jgi:hypothetical protein
LFFSFLLSLLSLSLSPLSFALSSLSLSLAHLPHTRARARSRSPRPNVTPQHQLLDLSANDLDEAFLRDFDPARQLLQLHTLRLSENRFRRLPKCFGEERLRALRVLDLSAPRHSEGVGSLRDDIAGSDEGDGSVLVLEAAHGTLSPDLCFYFTPRQPRILVGRPCVLQDSNVPKIVVGKEEETTVSRRHCYVYRESRAARGAGAGSDDSGSSDANGRTGGRTFVHYLQVRGSFLSFASLIVCVLINRFFPSLSSGRGFDEWNVLVPVPSRRRDE